MGVKQGLSGFALETHQPMLEPRFGPTQSAQSCPIWFARRSSASALTSDYERLSRLSGFVLKVNS